MAPSSYAERYTHRSHVVRAQQVLEASCCRRVQMAGRLVQEQHVRGERESPRERDALPLTCRQPGKGPFQSCQINGEQRRKLAKRS